MAASPTLPEVQAVYTCFYCLIAIPWLQHFAAARAFAIMLSMMFGHGAYLGAGTDRLLCLLTALGFATAAAATQYMAMQRT